MSLQEEILGHLIEIKTDVAEIKATIKDYPAVKAEVKQHTHDIIQAKTSIKLIKWFGGVVAVCATTAAAWMKVFKS